MPGGVARGSHAVVGLLRWLVSSHGFVDAEATLEHVDQAGPLELAAEDLERVVS
jgi:hypothetical protein